MVNNAIAWAHFQLRGGLKSSLWFCGVYAAAVVGFYTFARSADPKGMGMPSGWINLLLAIQSLSLVMFGASRVSAAIRGDLTTRMIESHRLMPTSPPMAIAGYLAGGAAQPLLISATTFAIGILISVTAGLATDRWILSNVILLIFAAFLWTLVSLGSFIWTAKGPMGMGWIFGLFALTAFSGGMITVFLPALTILISPIMGETIFVSATGSAVPSAGYAASLVGQIIIGSLYFAAASRRYRSAELTGFTPSMALGLILTWAAMTIFSIVRWDELRPLFARRARFDQDLVIIQATLSIGATMLLCLLPLAVSSRVYRDWRIRRALHDPGLERRPIHPAIAAMVCVIACTAISFCIPDNLIAPLGRGYVLNNLHLQKRLAGVISTGAMLAAFLFAISYLFRIMHRARARRTTIIVGLFVIFSWSGPIIVEVVRNVMNETHRFVWSRLAGASPAGTLILVWAEGGADPIPGIGVQLAVAAVLAMLFHLTDRRPDAPAPLATVPPLPA